MITPNLAKEVIPMSSSNNRRICHGGGGLIVSGEKNKGLVPRQCRDYVKTMGLRVLVSLSELSY